MKVPSPCIDVCKFKCAGHCIGCGMTKKQKKKFKRLKGRKLKRQFIEVLRAQQIEVGLKTNWERAYRRRCEKKGVDCCLDRLSAPDELDPRGVLQMPRTGDGLSPPPTPYKAHRWDEQAPATERG